MSFGDVVPHDVTRYAASRHTTTNYQLASLYCAPLKPATQPGGSHKRLNRIMHQHARALVIKEEIGVVFN